MDSIARWPSKERTELFRETATRRGLTPAIIEKDFWVCWTLGKLFASSSLSRKILFKGGTSLSKIFGLIERFSEDIDLILDWNEVSEEDPGAARSKSRQEKLNKQILSNSGTYIHKRLLPEVVELLGSVCNVYETDESPDVINIQYPAAFPDDYLRPEVRLEIGPLAQWIPNALYNISPYSAEEFPDIFKQSTCAVKAIKAERTFWEKATILHHEAHRPEENPQPLRYSRHYYDMARFAASDIKNVALRDIELLQAVVAFKQKFYPRGWAKYELAVPGTFKLMPPPHILSNLEKDYKDMTIMIYGEVPTFNEILQAIAKLEDEINQMA